MNNYTQQTVTSTPVSSIKKKPKSKEDILNFVENTWSYLSAHRSSFEQQVKESIHFYSSDQWVRFLPHNRKFVKHSLDEWVPTPMTNLIIDHVDRILDIFTSGDLLPIVDPATQDQPDVDAARAATRVLHSEFGRLGTEQNIIIPAALWLAVAGNCFISTTWNANKGDKMRIPKKRIGQKPIEQSTLECINCGRVEPAVLQYSACPECRGPMKKGKVYQLDDLGNEIMLDVEEETGEYDEYSIGNIQENLISPLNFFPEPATDMKRVRYAIETEAMAIDNIKELFGSKAKDVMPENLEFDSYGGLYAQGLNMNFGQDQESMDDHALVKWFRHVPDRRWKDGMLLIIANGKILHEGPLDDCGDGKLPYTHLKYRNVPDGFWGISLLNDLIPMQKRLNAIDSHVVQNRKQMISNQWLVPEGSGVNKVDGRSGLMIRWTPSTSGGFKPERMQGVPLPNQVMQEREQVKADMELVSGAKEVLQGNVPPGPETGAAIEAMQEQAFRRFGPLVKMWRAGLSEHEHKKLKLANLHWKESRVVRILGDNQELESYFLTGADLGQSSDMTVRVSIGMDYSQSAQRQKVMNAAQMGLLGDTRNPMVRGKILELLDIKGFDSEYTLDAKKARRYLEKMKEGEAPPPPESVDNHMVQFQVYKDYMLTSDFENLSEDIKQIIRQRAQIHQQFMQQQQMAMQQQAQAAKGAPEQVADQLAQTGVGGQSVPTQQ